MNWYLVKIVFQVITQRRDGLAEFDEQLRVITACSKEEAFEKACALGHNEEGVITNVHNQQLIEWKFINVSSLFRLKELLDGAQICSLTHQVTDGSRFIAAVHKKAGYIQNNDTLELLQLV